MRIVRRSKGVARPIALGGQIILDRLRRNSLDNRGIVRHLLQSLRFC